MSPEAPVPPGGTPSGDAGRGAAWDRGPASTGTRGRAFGILLAAVLALAAALRLAGLGEEALWEDEQHTLTAVEQPGLLAVLHHVRTNDPHPPLYFLGLHLWVRAFGSGDVAVRVPSALAGIAAVGLLVPVALRVRPGDRRLALLAAFMAASSPFLVYYSQEARSYAFLVLVELISLWGVLETWSLDPDASPRRRLPAAAAGAGGALLAVATHFFGIFILAWAAMVFVALAWRLRRGRPWPEAAAGVALVLGAVPAILAAVADWRSGHGLAWLPEKMVPADLITILAAQACGPIIAPSPPKLALAATIAFGAALAASLFAALVGAFRGGTPGAGGPTALAVVVVLGTPVAISYAVKPIVWYGHRFEIVAVPAVLLMIVSGLGSRWARSASAAALALMLACSAFYVVEMRRHRQKPRWDAAGAAVASAAKPGEAVVVIPPRLAPLLKRYAGAPVEPAGPEALVGPAAPRRAWVLATLPVRADIEKDTDYRVLGVQEFRGHAPGGSALYLYELLRAGR